MKRAVLKLIRYYQAFPKPHSCRFVPSCSDYTYEAITKYGIITGIFKGLKRIAKCHPFGKSGFDPLK